MGSVNIEPSERSQMIAKIFDGAAPTYDSVGVAWFRPIAERLVHELAPVPGEQALDVGCGRGAVLFPLAEAVGPTGHVAQRVEQQRCRLVVHGIHISHGIYRNGVCRYCLGHG
jgi:protein-L-isoaspartate O-methyltransferase